MYLFGHSAGASFALQMCDAFFPLNDVHATAARLRETGFVAEVTEMRNHDHDYYSWSATINDGAWKFLQTYSLPAEPTFTVYSNL